MTRPRLVLAAAILFACAACSGGHPATDGGTDGGTGGMTDEAYFGLAVGTCYGFLQAGGAANRPPDMTIGVEAADSSLGYPTRQVRYRQGGILLRTDYVTLSKGKVLLHRREDVGNPGLQVSFSPPIVLLERPERSTGTTPIVTDSTSTDVFTGKTAKWHVEVTLADAVSVQTTQRAKAYQAFPAYLLYHHPTLGADEQDKLWVVPGSGIVRADLNGSSWPNVTLSAVWQLKQGETRCTAP